METPLTMRSYIKDLEECRLLSLSLLQSSVGLYNLILELSVLNLRWENYQFNSKDIRDPFEVADELVSDTLSRLKIVSDLVKFSNSAQLESRTKKDLESNHQEIFQHLWIQFDTHDYEKRIQDYVNRLEVNQLGKDFMKNKKVLDLGCGHGNFLQACLKLGASYGVGIDFGDESIAYAKKFATNVENLEFKLGNVHNLQFDDNSFDFVIQNGVFHHLEDEASAYKEAYRVLKPGGAMWIYTDGGGIRAELWDHSRKILSSLPIQVINSTLRNIGYSVSKTYHLSDGLSAVYRHETLHNLIRRLNDIGFEDYRRLMGGEWFDLDGEFLNRKNRFEIAGDGDLRILIHKPLNN